MDRTEEERKYWDSFALDPDVDLKYISDIQRKPFLDMIGDLEGEVLDIGCGVGRLMKDGYHGVDISQNMINIAMERMPFCSFKLCDGRTIPYDADLFDSVYCVLLFQHLTVEGIASYIKETARVLKQGGVFVFQFIDHLDDGATGNLSMDCSVDRIKSELTGNNFDTVYIKKGEVHPLWTWVRAKKS